MTARDTTRPAGRGAAGPLDAPALRPHGRPRPEAAPPTPPLALTDYGQWLARLAAAEAAAAGTKLREHGLPHAGGDNVFALVSRTARNTGQSEAQVIRTWVDRQLVTAFNPALPADVRRKRLLDLYGYVCLELARLDRETPNGSMDQRDTTLPHGV